MKVVGMFSIPKDPFVCPFGKGLGPLHSYSFRDGIGARKISYEFSGRLWILRVFVNCKYVANL